MSSDRPASDVTAVVLTIGEGYTERALASVLRQMPPVAETVVVDGVHPFHRAFNEGARRVRTPFFVQVDADMVLDATCVADLRACVTDGVGIVVGHLRDPLLERVVGIKLFRTCCFDAVQLPDSVSPDTDFGAALEALGWHTIYALKGDDASADGWHVFGDHCPDYTPLYTFSKYLLEGARLRHRRVGRAARHLFRRLHASSHGAARFALIAAAHGIFAGPAGDSLRPYEPTAEFEFLQQLLNGVHASDVRSDTLRDLAGEEFGQAFRRGYRLGVDVRTEQASATLLACIDALAPQDDVAAWVALVGLCHGIFVPAYRESEVAHSFRLLGDLLTS